MVDKRDEADKLIDELIAGKTPEEIVGEGGLLQALTKRLYERALEGEMTQFLADLLIIFRYTSIQEKGCVRSHSPYW